MEYVHYGDALDGYDLINIPFPPFLINDYSENGAEPSRPNIFEEGNAASHYLYPIYNNPIEHFFIFSTGKYSNGDKSEYKKDESKIPPAPIRA